MISQRPGRQVGFMFMCFARACAAIVRDKLAPGTTIARRTLRPHAAAARTGGGSKNSQRPPSRPRARGSRIRQRQRQRLIDACISALHIYGPSRTTVEKVVALADLSPGIVRFYFDSKAAMLVASLEYLARGVRGPGAGAGRAAEGHAGAGAAAAGRAVPGCGHRQPAQGVGLVLVLGRGQLAPGVPRTSAARRTRTSPRWCAS